VWISEPRLAPFPCPTAGWRELGHTDRFSFVNFGVLRVYVLPIINQRSSILKLHSSIYNPKSPTLRSFCIPVYLCTCIPVYLCTSLPVYLFTCLPVYLFPFPSQNPRPSAAGKFAGRRTPLPPASDPRSRPGCTHIHPIWWSW
jgi:hypothetical protein